MKKTTSQLVHEYEEQMFKRLQTQVVKVVRANSLLSGNYANKKLQTGLLGIDLLLGGGIRPGTWYTSFGLEQSGKSTLAAQTMIAAYRESVPMVHFWDYEGSTGADTMYLERQMRSSGVKEPLESVMGDPEEAKPIAYWGEDVLETFFDTMAALLRRMPDRQFIDGKWFYVFDDDKYGKEMTDGKHDKSIKSKFGRLAVPGHSNALGGLVLLDSYPAMNPRALDTDDSKAGMALQARMFSEGVRKIRGKLRPKGVTIVGVNQLREKPGVMFGTPFYEPCFIGETKVLLADGTSIPIREIVENKLDVEVLSFDPKTGKVSPKKVIGWKANGQVPHSHLVTIDYQAYNRFGAPIKYSFTSTKNHKIWTPDGWKQAGELKAGSEIYLNAPLDTYSSDQMQVIYGGLLGDGTFQSASNSISWNVAYKHARYQSTYLQWKSSMVDYGNPLENISGQQQRYIPKGSLVQYTTAKHFSKKIAGFAQLLRSNHSKMTKERSRAARKVLQAIDLRGLAVWYMDDGHFANDRVNGMWKMTISCDRFTKSLKHEAIRVIKKLTGCVATIDKSHGKLSIVNKDNCLKFQNAVAPYVHASMAYKLYDTFTAGQYEWQHSDPVVKNKLLRTVVIGTRSSKLKSKYVNVYDLTVADNHTYFVGGAVHNHDSSSSNRKIKADCVAVSNCGGALKFASDGRIKCTQIANPWGEGRIQQEPSVDNEGTDSYQHMKYKLEKNKVGGINNFEVYQRIWVSDKHGNAHGFDKVADTYQYLSVTGQISGTRAKFLLPNEFGLKHMNYSQFKQLIIGSKSVKQSVAKQLGAKAVPNIRAFCGHQIETGVAQELAKKNANKAKKDNT